MGDNIFESIGKNMYELYVNPNELDAIWVNMPVNSNRGITKRICSGMKIRYDEGYMSATREDFNKEIITCYGTLVDQFRIKVKDIDTGIEEMIRL